MLPSEVASKATSFDLMITDVLATYERYEAYRARGEVMPMDDQFSSDELQDIIKKARKQ